MNEAKVNGKSASQNVKSLIQIIDSDDKVKGQAKISKVLKTMYHIKYAGKKMKVKKSDIDINIHGQNQTEIKNLSESLNNLYDYETFNESKNTGSYENLRCCVCGNKDIFLEIDMNSGPLDLTNKKIKEQDFDSLVDEQAEFCEKIGYEEGESYYSINSTDLSKLQYVKKQLETKYDYLGLGKLECLWSCAECEDNDEVACSSNGEINATDFIEDEKLIQKIKANEFNL